MLKNSVGTILLLTVLVASAWAGSISGKVTAGPGTSVVYVEAISGRTFPAPSRHLLMDQKGLRFEPHILVVQQGETVDFQNSDSVQHNVFWPSIGGDKKASHNMGTWPKGEKKSWKFDHPGVTPLFCNVHPEMSGYIVVSPTPYYSETDAGGNYTIKDIPDGSYTVTAWHEGMKPKSQPIQVSGAAKAEFTLSK